MANELKIQFKGTLPQYDLFVVLRPKLLEILSIITSEFFGVEEKHDEDLQKLGLLCEKILENE